MQKTIIKNVPINSLFSLIDQVNCQQGQVVSKTLAQNSSVSLTLFAFDKDEDISTHESEGDALVLGLSGTGRITIEGEDFILHEGESIVMPAGKPHAVFALEGFKMFLIVIFPNDRKEN
jgi:quercetin dioxygenase-like cupin family protein